MRNKSIPDEYYTNTLHVIYLKQEITFKYTLRHAVASCGIV